MDSSIQLFDNGKFIVRTITDENGEIWFVAKDVAQALDYSMTGSMQSLFGHVPEMWAESKRIAVSSENGVVQGRDVLCLSEQGLYFFLGLSDKPKALPYQMWVEGDVIPSIRRTGKYKLNQDANATVQFEPMATTENQSGKENPVRVNFLLDERRYKKLSMLAVLENTSLTAILKAGADLYIAAHETQAAIAEKAIQDSDNNGKKDNGKDEKNTLDFSESNQERDNPNVQDGEKTDEKRVIEMDKKKQNREMSVKEKMEQELKQALKTDNVNVPDFFWQGWGVFLAKKSNSLGVLAGELKQSSGVDKFDTLVATMPSGSQALANAMLIAHAPDMFRAFCNILGVITPDNRALPKWIVRDIAETMQNIIDSTMRQPTENGDTQDTESGEINGE